MIVNAGLRRFTGGIGQATFQPALSDSGAGVAGLTLLRGTGAATFTRATTAWTKLSTGLWASVASGQPRYCYSGLNTVAGVSGDGGYLATDAATQLVTPTASIRDMTDAAWVKVTMTTAKTATGIDGAANSATTLTAAGAASTILQTLIAAASSRTYAAFVRRKTGTGTITLVSGASTLDITALINSTTYTLVQLTSSDLNAAFGFNIATSGDAIEVDFNQFEAGNAWTTPLDTAGASRAADVLSYSTVGNIDFTKGTLFAEANSLLGTGKTALAAQALVWITGGIPLYIDNAAAATTITCFDGTTSVTKASLGNMFTSIRKVASSWGSAGLSATGGGFIAATAAFDGAIGSVGTINIGNNTAGGNQWNGIIKTIEMYQYKFENLKLRRITE